MYSTTLGAAGTERPEMRDGFDVEQVERLETEADRDLVIGDAVAVTAGTPQP